MKEEKINLIINTKGNRNLYSFSNLRFQCNGIDLILALSDISVIGSSFIAKTVMIKDDSSTMGFKKIDRKGIACLMNGELINVSMTDAGIHEGMEIVSMAFCMEDTDENFYLPEKCYDRYIRKEIIFRDKIVEMTLHDYEKIAEQIRRDDAKKLFLQTINDYTEDNKEFENVRNFLMENIGRASDKFYKKIRTSMDDYDIPAVLNVFRGAFWCDIYMKNGSKQEAVLMDSQILQLQNGQIFEFANVNGEKFNSSDVKSLARDDYYTIY